MSKHLNSNIPTCKGIVIDSGDGEFIVKGYVKSLQTDQQCFFGLRIQRHTVSLFLVRECLFLIPK